MQRFRSVGVLGLMAVALGLSLDAAENVVLKAAFDEKGPSSLSYAGLEFVRPGGPEVLSVTLEKVGKDEKGFRSHAFEKLTAAPTRTTFDPAKSTWTATFAWGEAAIAYSSLADRLGVVVTLTNRSDRALADFSMRLLPLQFPGKPEGLKDKGNLRSGLDNPVIVTAGFPKAQVLACMETIDPPTRFGFADLHGKEKPETALMLCGGVMVEEPGECVIGPLGRPRIEPGKSLTIECSLRFAAAGADTQPLVEDVYRSFAAHYRWMNDWADRRPIGMLMRSSNYKGHKSETNPRGWFWDAKLDAISKEGKAKFKEAALNDAERCISTLKSINGQGMIFWDPEGSENPHPVTYIGDPRLAAKLAPEFDEIADEYFRKFLDAGLRTGVCIRPSQVYFDAAKKQWSHGTGSDGAAERGDHYPALRAADIPWWRFYPIVERMCDKIAYAKKRWGCTLFYIDTNGIFQGVGEKQEFKWRLLSAEMLRRIKEKHPDVLLIPELVGGDGAYHTAYWSAAAPYFELDLGGCQSPAHVRRLWPNAFSIINVTDGDFVKNREKLKEGVKAGDIILVHGWYGAKRNQEVKELYDEVAREKGGK